MKLKCDWNKEEATDAYVRAGRLKIGGHTRCIPYFPSTLLMPPSSLTPTLCRHPPPPYPHTILLPPASLPSPRTHPHTHIHIYTILCISHLFQFLHPSRYLFFFWLISHRTSPLSSPRSSLLYPKIRMKFAQDSLTDCLFLCLPSSSLHCNITVLSISHSLFQVSDALSSLLDCLSAPLLSVFSVPIK